MRNCAFNYVRHNCAGTIDYSDDLIILKHIYEGRILFIVLNSVRQEETVLRFI